MVALPSSQDTEVQGDMEVGNGPRQVAMEGPAQAMAGRARAAHMVGQGQEVEEEEDILQGTLEAEGEAAVVMDLVREAL